MKRFKKSRVSFSIIKSCAATPASDVLHSQNQYAWINIMHAFRQEILLVVLHIVIAFSGDFKEHVNKM